MKYILHYCACGGEKYGSHDDENNLVIECSKCGAKETVKPKPTSCIACGAAYKEYSWFDPGACPVCHKSFLD